jgi:hypothetical protein
VEIEKPKYRLQLTIHMSLEKGGCFYGYDMVDYPGISISKMRETRNSAMRTEYIFQNTVYSKLADVLKAWETAKTK